MSTLVNEETMARVERALERVGEAAEVVDAEAPVARFNSAF